MTLRKGDLQDLVYKIFHIDSYKSKMGSDSDIAVLSFTVSYEDAAKDFVSFIENGYSFVLDAGQSTGELDDGMYKVFVEIQRDSKLPENIIELIDGIKKLTNRNKFKFRYYKGFKSFPVNIEMLSLHVPTDTKMYDAIVSESNLNNTDNFFNKSFLNEVSFNDDILTLKKSYAEPVSLVIKDFGKTNDIYESITDRINMNDYAEILFLTKYIGDYNVTKYGNKTLTFENKDYTLVVERT